MQERLQRMDRLAPARQRRRMTSTTVRTLTAATAIGSGAMGGVFFAFSAFVMPALAQLPAGQAVSAMQAVNRAAVTPAFMTGLFGTAALSLVLSVRALLGGAHPRPLLLAGGALYLVGTIGLTVVRHVPLNDALALVDAHCPQAAQRWSEYTSGWTGANTVRAVAALAAAAAYTAAARVA